jgi:hypothetical protein
VNLSLTVAVVLVLLCAALVGGYFVLSGVSRPPPSASAPMNVTPPPLPETADGPAPPAMPLPEAAPADPTEEGKPPEPEPAAAPKAADTAAAITWMKKNLETRTFSFSVKGIRLEEALKLVAAFYDMEVDTSALSEDQLDQEVAAEFDEVTGADALQFLCDVTNLEYEVGPRGVTIR